MTFNIDLNIKVFDYLNLFGTTNEIGAYPSAAMLARQSIGSRVELPGNPQLDFVICNNAFGEPVMSCLTQGGEVAAWMVGALNFGEQDYRLLFRLGRYLTVFSGHPDVGVLVFRRMLELFPRNIAATLWLARSLSLVGRHGEAMNVLWPMLAVMPDDPEALCLWKNIRARQVLAVQASRISSASPVAAPLEPLSTEGPSKKIIAAPPARHAAHRKAKRPAKQAKSKGKGSQRAMAGAKSRGKTTSTKNN